MARTQAAARHDLIRQRASLQGGMVSRRQLLDAGWTRGSIDGQVNAGRWRAFAWGVVLTHEGQPDAVSRIWAALLSAPPGAVACHETAAWIHGLLAEEPDTVHIRVGVAQHHRITPGIHVHRSRAPTHQVLRQSVPATGVECTVLDLVADSAKDSDAVHWILHACQRRLTTPKRLLRALAERGRQRRAGLVREICAEAAGGVDSSLELRYLREVERAHGLPKGRRQVAGRLRGGMVYRDVEYSVYAVVIELDGRRFHSAEAAAFRDRARDNATARQGKTTLRYGWRDTVGDPCGVAAEVAQVLKQRGWRGELKGCGEACTAVSPLRGGFGDL